MTLTTYTSPLFICQGFDSPLTVDGHGGYQTQETQLWFQSLSTEKQGQIKNPGDESCSLNQALKCNSCLCVQFCMSSRSYLDPISSRETWRETLSDTRQINVMNYVSKERGAHKGLIDSWAFQSLDGEKFFTPSARWDSLLMRFTHYIQSVLHHKPKKKKKKRLNAKLTRFADHYRGNANVVVLHKQ